MNTEIIHWGESVLVNVLQYSVEWTQKLSTGRELFTPPIGLVHPLLMLTHTPKLCSPIGCVCIRTQHWILGISLLGNPDILSVLVCLASVCILRQCFIVVRFYL